MNKFRHLSDKFCIFEIKFLFYISLRYAIKQRYYRMINQKRLIFHNGYLVKRVKLS